MQLSPHVAALVALGAVACTREVVVDTRPDRDACEACHRAVSLDGVETGIETAHVGKGLGCTDCHGGDPEGVNQDAAHAVSLADPLRGKSTVGLTRIDPTRLRLGNPADLRAAPRSCGALAGGDCHEEIVTTVSRSLTATFAGALTTPRRLLGNTERPVGVVGATDAADTLADGAVPRVDFFPHPAAVGASDAELLDLVLRKACARCHAYDFGTSTLPGDFRGSGCGACHAPYAPDGASASHDAAGRPEPPTVRTHQLERVPSDEACARCHQGGARIALSYRGLAPAAALGYREIAPGQPTREAGPPDVHAAAGLGCTDCHVGDELHGSRSLYASRYDSPSLACADCHGTGAREAPDRNGRFAAAAGWDLPALARAADGAVELTARDGTSHVVTQLARSDAPAEAHGEEHARVACAACHATFTITCVGCHVTIDAGGEPVRPSPSLIDDLWTVGGSLVEEGLAVDTDLFLLGEAPDGTVYPVVAAEPLLVTHVDETGATLRDRQLLRDAADRPVFGLAAVEPHTVGAARVCDACHVRADGSNEEAIRRIVGAAATDAIVVEGDGTEWDVGRLLDDELRPRSPATAGRARPLSTARARLLLEEPLP